MGAAIGSAAIFVYAMVEPVAPRSDRQVFDRVMFLVLTQGLLILPFVLFAVHKRASRWMFIIGSIMVGFLTWVFRDPVGTLLEPSPLLLLTFWYSSIALILFESLTWTIELGRRRRSGGLRSPGA